MRTRSDSATRDRSTQQTTRGGGAGALRGSADPMRCAKQTEEMRREAEERGHHLATAEQRRASKLAMHDKRLSPAQLLDEHG